MLKFSIHESSSETDLRSLRGGEMSDTSSYSMYSSQRDGDHNCRECDKRRRALSKERIKLSKYNSRSLERLNYNNNRCNHDISVTSSETTTNYDMSDGQDSTICTTSTSNSEMSSSTNTSFYKRFTLRSKSKDASRKEKRSESPEASSRSKHSDQKDGERRGRRGLWELQKAATRVIGPESRVGRWVGKLRSRSSEARLGSLKSRYSEIRNWGGWKLEDRESVADNSMNPMLMVNDRPVSPVDRPIYGKKIIRSRSTEAIGWPQKQDRPREFAREVPVRKSFEKAINNKMGLSQETHSVRKTKLHSRFESEPNLVRKHLYAEQRNERRSNIADDRSRSHHSTRDMRRFISQKDDIVNSDYNLQNNQRHDRRSRSTQSRQSCRNSIEQVRDSARHDSDNLRCESRHRDESPRNNIYRKNANVPTRNFRKPPSGQRLPTQSGDSQRDVRRTHKSREDIKYERKYYANAENLDRENRNRQRHHVRVDSRSNFQSPEDSKLHTRNSCHTNRHDRTLEQNQKPVRAQYTPPKLAPNKAYVKSCSLKPGPRDSNHMVPSQKAFPPPHKLSTKVSTSCTALHEINNNNNLKRYHSEQQLKRTSMASLLSIESLDSGTSCSDNRPSLTNNEKGSQDTSPKGDNHSNISARSSDSGYRSPVSPVMLQKDWKDVESLVLTSCFGEEMKSAKKPIVSTSDYESESGFEDKFMATDASTVQFPQKGPKMWSTEELNKGQTARRQQRSTFRKSPKKTKQNGHASRYSEFETIINHAELSNLTTKVRARLNHKAMSSAEISVHRGDVLYFNRDSLTDDRPFWVRAYSSITGDIGLVPTVILCTRMEDLV